MAKIDSYSKEQKKKISHRFLTLQPQLVTSE